MKNPNTAQCFQFDNLTTDPCLIPPLHRLKKMERIAQLDNEVTQLKEENINLVQMKEKLKEEARQLKVKLVMHVDNGCDIAGVAGVWEVGRPDSTC